MVLFLTGRVRNHLFSSLFIICNMHCLTLSHSFISYSFQNRNSKNCVVGVLINATLQFQQLCISVLTSLIFIHLITSYCLPATTNNNKLFMRMIKLFAININRNVRSSLMMM
jgi:hypothetical protein